MNSGTLQPAVSSELPDGSISLKNESLEVRTRRKRVLLVSLGYDFGGVEVYLKNLVELLDGKAEFFALTFQPELIKVLANRSVRIIKLPRLPRFSKALVFPIAALMLLPVVLLYRIDSVQINGYAESILLMLARLAGCKAISTRHLTMDVTAEHWYQAPGSFLARFLYKMSARFANRIICVSNVVGVDVQKFVVPDRVVVIPNWVSRIYADGVAPRNSRAAKRILFVGRLEKHKGLHLLLEALLGIENVELTVVGEGPCRREYETQAESLRVRFAGFQSNPDSFFAAADLFVMPSLGPEGLPLVSLEAMAHRLPCLFSDLPVHKEITSDGDAAMLFATGDASSLREKLIFLLKDESLRHSYAEKAYRTIQTRFSAAVAERAYAHEFEI